MCRILEVPIWSSPKLCSTDFGVGRTISPPKNKKRVLAVYSISSAMVSYVCVLRPLHLIILIAFLPLFRVCS